MASLLLTSQRARLITNGRRAATEQGFDPYPVVRLYARDSAAQWLLSEIHPDDPNTAFGIIDPGDGGEFAREMFETFSTSRQARITASHAGREYDCTITRLEFQRQTKHLLAPGRHAGAAHVDGTSSYATGAQSVSGPTSLGADPFTHSPPPGLDKSAAAQRGNGSNRNGTPPLATEPASYGGESNDNPSS
ncbi:MAG: DUF2958 domain-containing protein, partial [Rhodomicrobium sp.]|nr:DUF2958 domain-containing protein [Rhodomicrobium sp.]